MQYCWIVLGIALGWWGKKYWMSRQRCRAASPFDRGDAELSNARAGIARQHRDIEATISQIEAILQEAGSESGSVELAHKLLDSKRALSTYLADSYDALRKYDRKDAAAEPWKDQNREALNRFLKERLATRERYGNPFAVAMFFIDASAVENDAMEAFQKLIRITDRVFLLNQHEYVVVLPETDLAGAQVFAVRCAQSMTETLGARAFAGTTAGRDGDGLRNVLSRVDTALYRAKCDEQQFVFSHDGERIEPFSISLSALA